MKYKSKGLISSGNKTQNRYNAIWIVFDGHNLIILIDTQPMEECKKDLQRGGNTMNLRNAKKI